MPDQVTLVPEQAVVLEPLNGAIRLNVGCGDCPAAGYYNIDSNYEVVTAVAILGMQAIHAPAHALPVADACADVVYASHILEHYPVACTAEGQPTAFDALDEWARVLKPGGQLFVAVPNFEEIARRAISQRATRDDWVLHLFGQPRPGMNHYWGWTGKALVAALNAHGFGKISGGFECFMFKPSGGVHDASGGTCLADDGTPICVSMSFKAVREGEPDLPDTPDPSDLSDLSDLSDEAPNA